MQIHRFALVIRPERRLREDAAALALLRLVRGLGRGAALQDLLDRLGAEARDLVVVLLRKELLSAVLEQLLYLGRLEWHAFFAPAALGERVFAGGVFAFLDIVVRAVSNDRMLESELLVGRIEEVHLVRVARHQPVDAHELGLADAMAARLGLQVVLWVPVGIVDDDRVGGRQVDAHAARARAQQEEKGIRVRRAVAVDGSLPLVASHRPVQALVAEASQLDVLFDQVEEHRELREEEHTVALLA